MISICCLSLSESDAGGSRVIKFSYIKFFIFVCGGGGERNKHKKKKTPKETSGESKLVFGF